MAKELDRVLKPKLTNNLPVRYKSKYVLPMFGLSQNIKYKGNFRSSLLFYEFEFNFLIFPLLFWVACIVFLLVAKYISRVE